MIAGTEAFSTASTASSSRRRSSSTSPATGGAMSGARQDDGYGAGGRVGTCRARGGAPRRGDRWPAAAAHGAACDARAPGARRRRRTRSPWRAWLVAAVGAAAADGGSGPAVAVPLLTALCVQVRLVCKTCSTGWWLWRADVALRGRALQRGARPPRRHAAARRLGHAVGMDGLRLGAALLPWRPPTSASSGGALGQPQDFPRPNGQAAPHGTADGDVPRRFGRSACCRHVVVLAACPVDRPCGGPVLDLRRTSAGHRGAAFGPGPESAAGGGQARSATFCPPR